MTDEEKRVDEEIQSHLKKVYGFSEDQLLKEVEAAEKSVNDLDFSGAEDRIYERMLERRAEKEKREETVEECMADKPEAEDIDKEKPPARKVVRFRKKTILLVAAVAAILALMVGSTAIGEKNYFFRRVGDGVKHNSAIDNDSNKLDSSKLEEAYKEISEKLNIKVIKLGYIPSEMYFDELIMGDNKALIVFDYNGSKVNIVQEYSDIEISIDPQSDRKECKDTVENRLIKQIIPVCENTLENNQMEYSIEIRIRKAQYRIKGVMEKEEFKNIIRFLFFY